MQTIQSVTLYLILSYNLLFHFLQNAIMNNEYLSLEALYELNIYFSSYSSHLIRVYNHSMIAYHLLFGVFDIVEIGAATTVIN